MNSPGIMYSPSLETYAATGEGETWSAVVAEQYPIRWSYVNLKYCGVYNLTQRRLVTPFENLTLLISVHTQHA